MRGDGIVSSGEDMPVEEVDVEDVCLWNCECGWVPELGSMECEGVGLEFDLAFELVRGVGGGCPTPIFAKYGFPPPEDSESTTGGRRDPISTELLLNLEAFRLG